MVDHKGFDVGLGRALEGKCSGLVAANGNDLPREIPFSAGFNESLKVGATAGGEHQDFR